MKKRVNTAFWVEKEKRWCIAVQKNGTRKRFYSSTPGRTGQREANAKADAWLDDSVRNGIVAEYQSRWDDGERFTGLSAMDMILGAKREGDTEEELAACVDELAERIKTALVAQWAKQYGRSQMVSVLNAITDLDVNASVNMYGAVVRSHEIVRAWNNTRPDEEPISTAPSIEI